MFTHRIIRTESPIQGTILATDQTSYLPNCHPAPFFFFFFLFLKRIPEDRPDEVSRHSSDPVILMNIFNTKTTRLSPALGTHSHAHSRRSLERGQMEEKGQDALHSGQQPLPEKPCPVTCHLLLAHPCFWWTSASTVPSGDSPRQQNSCLDQSPKSHS